jgi:hypothetical protein
VLTVDGDAPTVAVQSVSFSVGDTVSTDGHAPLQVSWTATDETTGVAGATLIVDATPLSSSATSPTTYSSTDGTHSLQVQVTDLAGNSATSTSWPLTRTSVQESVASLTKVKSWKSATSASPWGTTRFSKKRGATSTYTFTGTDVAWVSSRAPKRGKAKVYIDGVKVAVVDLKSATTKSSVIVYASSGLAAGQHTIKVYVNGTGGRPRVDIDGFVVLDQR